MHTREALLPVEDPEVVVLEGLLVEKVDLLSDLLVLQVVDEQLVQTFALFSQWLRLLVELLEQPKIEYVLGVIKDGLLLVSLTVRSPTRLVTIGNLRSTIGDLTLVIPIMTVAAAAVAFAARIVVVV